MLGENGHTRALRRARHKLVRRMGVDIWGGDRSHHGACHATAAHVDLHLARQDNELSLLQRCLYFLCL